MDSQTYSDGVIDTSLPPVTEALASDLCRFLDSGSNTTRFHASQGEQRLSGWHASVILEQCASFYLLQETATKLYCLYEVQTQLPLLKTDQWAEAYRSWLNLRHQCAAPIAASNPTAPADLSAEALHDWVSQHQDSAYFGQLLYSRDRQFQGTLQYLVRLSETHGLRWAPATVQPIALGQLTLEVLGQRRHRPAKWLEPRSSVSMADALHRSIKGLHQRCQYDLYRFNSEHWARLITTGRGCSFQKEELYAYWQSQTQIQAPISELQEKIAPEIWEENLEAQVLLLMAIAP
jgi:hypothetical protein